MKRILQITILTLALIFVFVMSGCSAIVIQACTDDGQCTDFERRNGCDDCQETPQECYDSDDKDYKNKGNVQLGSDVFEDVCTSSEVLKERICADGASSIELITCQHGCSDGACKLAPLECTETDNGNEPLVQGTSKIGETVQTDACTSNTQLDEKYCSANNGIQTQNVTCENGCLNGACLQETNSITGATTIRYDGVFVQISDGIKNAANPHEVRLTLPETCWFDGVSQSSDGIQYQSFAEADHLFEFNSIVCIDGEHVASIELLVEENSNLIVVDELDVEFTVANDFSDVGTFSCGTGSCVVESPLGTKSCNWPLSFNEVGTEADPVVSVIDGSVPARPQFSPQTEKGLQAFAESVGLDVVAPYNIQCGGAYSCTSGKNADENIVCVHSGSNIFGAGECTMTEESEQYACDTGLCTREWVEWTCTHTTLPRTGCESDPQSTKDDVMTSDEALEAAVAQAAQSCCPCGKESPLMVVDGTPFGKGADYRGYACQC